MKRTALILAVFLGFSSQALAIPSLQVGAPAGTGDTGVYADYQGSLTNPTESDTAQTSGSTLYVVGAYKNKPELLIGGQYIGTAPDGTSLTGDNWSAFSFANVFNSHRALLMATVPNGTLGVAGNSVKVNGVTPFYSTSTFEDGFIVPNPPSNHDPIKNQDYLFFDIGDFAQSILVPNLPDESTGNQMGEIKSFTLAVTGFEWAHFDAFALDSVLDQTTGKVKTYIVDVSEVGNPGSHDVTWKEDGVVPPQEVVVPEPGTFVLLGLGMAALGLYRRTRRS